MSKKRINMEKVFEVYRLHFKEKNSQRQIAKKLDLPKTTVNDYIQLARIIGLEWKEIEQYEEKPLELLKRINPDAIIENQEEQDAFFEAIQEDLKKHHSLTLKLKHEELKAQNHYDKSYQYLARQYRKWKNRSDLSMKKEHKGGEIIEIDYSGDKIPLYDRFDKVIGYADLFVGTCPASHYMYARATANQKSQCFIEATQKMLEYFGGVPELIKPDNCKTAVSKASYYSPKLHIEFEQLANHYGFEVFPARVRKPKDKASVERGVLLAQQRIIAALRNKKFTTIEELNEHIEEKLIKINSDSFQKLKTSRKELFEKVTKPNLKPLPIEAFEHFEHKEIKVKKDYHISLEEHDYSVPYQYSEQFVSVWYNKEEVRIFSDSKLIALHKRSIEPRGATTNAAHRPKAHEAVFLESKDHLLKEAKDIGQSVHTMVEALFSLGIHEKIACKKAKGILALIKQHDHLLIESFLKEMLGKNILSVDNIMLLADTRLPKLKSNSHVRSQFN